MQEKISKNKLVGSQKIPEASAMEDVGDGNATPSTEVSGERVREITKRISKKKAMSYTGKVDTHILCT